MPIHAETDVPCAEGRFVALSIDGSSGFCFEQQFLCQRNSVTADLR